MQLKNCFLNLPSPAELKKKRKKVLKREKNETLNEKKRERKFREESANLYEYCTASSTYGYGCVHELQAVFAMAVIVCIYLFIYLFLQKKEEVGSAC